MYKRRFPMVKHMRLYRKTDRSEKKAQVHKLHRGEVVPVKLRQTAAELAQSLPLPPEAVSTAMHVTVSGRRQVMVEYHRGLLGYTQEAVEVRGSTSRLRILGNGLQLHAMDQQTLIIRGQIAALEYE
jgi:sporulation protein YqfC